MKKKSASNSIKGRRALTSQRRQPAPSSKQQQINQPVRKSAARQRQIAITSTALSTANATAAAQSTAVAAALSTANANFFAASTANAAAQSTAAFAGLSTANATAAAQSTAVAAALSTANANFFAASTANAAAQSTAAFAGLSTANANAAAQSTAASTALSTANANLFAASTANAVAQSTAAAAAASAQSTAVAQSTAAASALSTANAVAAAPLVLQGRSEYADTFTGGSLNDTLQGWHGTGASSFIDSLTGGAGNDFFVIASGFTSESSAGIAGYSGAYALITDYGNGSDIISVGGFTGGAIFSVSGQGTSSALISYGISVIAQINYAPAYTAGTSGVILG